MPPLSPPSQYLAGLVHELCQLPAPRFETTPLHTRAVLFAHKDFEAMTLPKRVHACYLRACLRYLLRDYMTNESLRERFGLVAEKSYTVSPASSPRRERPA
jgi:predicted HTH transcriptional regulator